MSIVPAPADPVPLFVQLAGHSLRWRLLQALGRSDRTVSELTGLVGEPQNLVSYHLGKLRAGRLVSARRSSADRRDTYYGLDLPRIGGLLSAAGGALHPGLRLSPPTDRGAIAPVRVLFLCTGNSARSPMAAALAHALSNGAVDAFSAGSHPKPVHPNAVRALWDGYGLDIAGHAPVSLTAFANHDFDWVISLCDRVREVCPEFPGAPQTIHWSLPNPADDATNDALSYPLFEQTAADLAGRIAYLLAGLERQASPPPPFGETHGRPQ